MKPKLKRLAQVVTSPSVSAWEVLTFSVVYRIVVLFLPKDATLSQCFSLRVLDDMAKEYQDGFDFGSKMPRGPLL